MTTEQTELDLRKTKWGDTLHRPRIAIWITDPEEDDNMTVVMSVGALHGQQLRYVDMTPGEADILARALCEHAEAVRRLLASTPF